MPIFVSSLRTAWSIVVFLGLLLSFYLILLTIRNFEENKTITFFKQSQSVTANRLYPIY